MNNSIDFSEVPKTRALKEHLDDLLDSLRELDAITIPSETLVETENIWDLEEVKNASLKIQEKIVALYKLASLKNEKEEQELCYKASLNMKELVNAVNYARTEWENVVTGNEPEEDPNVMVVKAIDFLEEYSIPKILRTAYHIELSEIYKEDEKIPVTILTGFLGAGKTTLLNYVLKENHGLKICVIENEYGEQSIDDDLLKNNSNESVKTDEIIETMNGCICCTIRKDLIEVINRLLKEKKGKFNHIIIESTGVADPGPIISSFYTDMTLSMQCRIDSVVTLVDAYHIDEQISRGDNSTIEQIAFADKIVLNKVDLLERKTEEKDELKRKEFVSSEIERLSHKINKINKTAKVLHSSYSKVPLEEILNVNGFELDKVLDLDEKIFEKAEKEHKHKKDHDHDHDHHHDKEHKHKHKHQKGDKIGTVCFSIEGEADFSLLREWLQETLKTHGKDMFRAKGIFAIKDNPNKIAIQSTHEICDLNPIGAWKEGEKKVSKFVVIGRNIKQIALIEEDFKKCFN